MKLARGGKVSPLRQLHRTLMPFMTVNFVEANPIPIKAAMAMLGLLEERYRLPMVPPQPASREKIAAVLANGPAHAGPYVEAGFSRPDTLAR